MNYMKEDISVGSDPMRWPDAALNMLLRTFPQLDGAESSVSIDHVDEQTLSGQGVVAIRHGEQAAEVPFFIDNGIIQPLDVFYYQGEPHPMTADRLNDLILARGEPGQVSTQKTPSAHQSLAQSDTGLRGVKAASALYQTVFAGSSDTIRKQAAWTAPMEDLVLLGCEQAVARLADEPEGVKQATDESEDQAVQAVSLSRQAPGLYRVTEYARFGQAKTSGLIEGGNARAYFEALGCPEALDQADQTGFVAVPLWHQPPPLLSVDLEADKIASDENVNGPAVVVDPQGQAHQGILCAGHALNGDPLSEQVFVGSGVWARGTKMAAGADDPADGWPRVLADQDMVRSSRSAVRFAKTACWAWQDDDGTFHATEPFRLDGVHRVGDRIKVAASDSLGHRVDYEISDRLLRIAPARQTKEATLPEGYDPVRQVAYLIPSNYHLVALGDKMSVADPDAVNALYQDQQAAERGGNTVEVIAQGGQYSMVCAALDEKKQASTLNLSHPEMRVLWACAGFDKEAQDHLMASLVGQPRLTAYGVPLGQAFAVEEEEVVPPPVYDEKKLSAAYEVVHRVRPHLWDVVKVAAAAPEEEQQYLTDSAMATALTERNQMETLTDGLPVLEAASKKLAEMLILTRTEDTDLRPEVVAQAMRSMDQVVQALRSVDPATNVEPANVPHTGP